MHIDISDKCWQRLRRHVEGDDYCYLCDCHPSRGGHASECPLAIIVAPQPSFSELRQWAHNFKTVHHCGAGTDDLARFAQIAIEQHERRSGRQTDPVEPDEE